MMLCLIKILITNLQVTEAMYGPISGTIVIQSDCIIGTQIFSSRNCVELIGIHTPERSLLVLLDLHYFTISL